MILSGTPAVAVAGSGAAGGIEAAGSADGVGFGGEYRLISGDEKALTHLALRERRSERAGVQVRLVRCFEIASRRKFRDFPLRGPMLAQHLAGMALGYAQRGDEVIDPSPSRRWRRKQLLRHF